MRIKAHELSRTFQKPPKAYWVSGDEPLLIDEAIQELLTAFKSDETELIRINVDQSFSEDQLMQWIYGGSLFAQSQLLLITLNEKWPARFNTLLQQALKDMPDSIRLLIHGPRLSAAQMKSKWVQAIDRDTAFVAIWPINAHQLPQWLIQRARQQFHMNLHPSAAHLIAELTEGNLLAAGQTLEKLNLEFGATEITLDQVENSLSDMTHFSVFSLTESCLMGDSEKSLRILQTLFEKQVEITLILWSLTQEIRLLTRLMFEAQSAPLNILFQKHRIIERRKAPLQKAIQRLKPKNCEQLLQKAAQVDRRMKGIESGNAQQTLMEWVEVATA